LLCLSMSRAYFHAGRLALYLLTGQDYFPLLGGGGIFLDVLPRAPPAPPPPASPGRRYQPRDPWG
jgi:hypothetical protein